MLRHMKCDTQADNWIDERLKNITEESPSAPFDIQDKMKKLQKHQAFEAEIMANTDRINAVKQVSCFHNLITARLVVQI